MCLHRCIFVHMCLCICVCARSWMCVCLQSVDSVIKSQMFCLQEYIKISAQRPLKCYIQRLLKINHNAVLIMGPDMFLMLLWIPLHTHWLQEHTPKVGHLLRDLPVSIQVGTKTEYWNSGGFTYTSTESGDSQCHPSLLFSQPRLLPPHFKGVCPFLVTLCPLGPVLSLLSQVTGHRTSSNLVPSDADQKRSNALGSFGYGQIKIAFSCHPLPPCAQFSACMISLQRL